jgi:hypothetical protein
MVAVAPRVVWAGDGILLPEEPAVSIWQVGLPTGIADDLDTADRVDNIHINQVKDVLHALADAPSRPAIL